MCPVCMRHLIVSQSSGITEPIVPGVYWNTQWYAPNYHVALSHGFCIVICLLCDHPHEIKKRCNQIKFGQNYVRNSHKNYHHWRQEKEKLSQSWKSLGSWWVGPSQQLSTHQLPTHYPHIHSRVGESIGKAKLRKNQVGQDKDCLINERRKNLKKLKWCKGNHSPPPASRPGPSQSSANSYLGKTTPKLYCWASCYTA